MEAGLNRQPDREVQLATRLSLDLAICLVPHGHTGLSLSYGSGRDLLGPTRLSPQPAAHRTAGYPRPDYVKADRPGLWPLDQVRGLCGEVGSGRAVPFSELAIPQWTTPLPSLHVTTFQRGLACTTFRFYPALIGIIGLT